MKKTGENKNCLQCKKEFYVSGWGIVKGRGKYCSMKCYQIAEKGRVNPNISGLEIGHGWNKGIRLEKIIGLKREEVENYDGLHHWIGRRLGKPMRCELCGTTEEIKYNWANISQTYKKDPLDWMRLCIKCHRDYDKQFYKNERKYL